MLLTLTIKLLTHDALAVASKSEIAKVMRMQNSG
jgi:hypothetical protein